MQTSVFLARLIGPPLLIVGIGILINRDYYLALTRQFVGSAPLMYLGAVVGMVAGLAIVLVHNVWAADWRVLITLFGWLNAIGGAVRLLAPAWVMQTGRAMLKRPYFVPLAAAIWVVAGSLFCLFGFLR